MKILSKKLLALFGCVAVLTSSFILPASAQDEANDITIHAGDYPQLETVDAEGNKGYYTTTVFANSENGGKFIHLAADASDRNTVEGFKVIIPLDINEGGIYNIDFDMCGLVRSLDSERWNSPVRLKIDNGEYFRVKAFATDDEPDITAAVLNTALSDKYSADSEKGRWAEYALNPVELTAGEHTLTFWVYDKPPLQNKDWFVFGLGEINITQITDFSELDNITIHAGLYPKLETVDENGDKGIYTTTVYSNSENGGKFIHLAADASDSGTVEGFKVIIPFKVHKGGVYDIKLDMCSYSQIAAAYRWNSKTMIKIDDGEFFWAKAFATADDPNVTAKVLSNNLADKYAADSERARWSEYALNPVKLETGEHTLTVWVSDKPPLQNKDWFVFGLGEINITPAADKTEILVEGEDLPLENASTVIEDGLYNGGKYLNLTGNGSIRMKFHASRTGNYKLRAVASGDVDYIIDNNVVTFAKTEDASGLLADEWKNRMSKTIVLEEGVHQLEIKTNEETRAYKLDCINIFKELDLTSIEALEPDVLSIGDVGKLTFINQDNDAVTANNFDTVSYESSNKDVIAVDEYGRLKAKNAGEATITVSATANEKALNASVKVFVAGKTGLYIKSAEVSGNDIRVTLAAKSSAAGAQVVAGVCGVENGVITSFKDVKIIDFASISAGENSTETVTMSEIGENDRVIVFVFDGADILKPLWGKTVAE